jgi:hypothetical protein
VPDKQIFSLKLPRSGYERLRNEADRQGLNLPELTRASSAKHAVGWSRLLG